MRRRMLALTAAAMAAAAEGKAMAQSPSLAPRLDELRMHQDRTKEFERGFRAEFPPPSRGAVESRSRSEGREREAAERAARQGREEQDRRARALPWSAAPWSDGRWGR